LSLLTHGFLLDLVGFTKWSSGRAPADVFLLLETLYGDFDKIARRRRVFKVETIGDCYVAVTGIPKPQKDHALIMTKFAQDCMLKMKQTLVDLQPQLGGTTQDLAMRVGLVSDPLCSFFVAMK
jgi:class 3 adenylate cyclase